MRRGRSEQVETVRAEGRYAGANSESVLSPASRLPEGQCLEGVAARCQKILKRGRHPRDVRLHEIAASLAAQLAHQSCHSVGHGHGLFQTPSSPACSLDSGCIPFGGPCGERAEEHRIQHGRFHGQFHGSSGVWCYQARQLRFPQPGQCQSPGSFRGGPDILKKKRERRLSVRS